MKGWSLNNFQVLFIFIHGFVLTAEKMTKNSANSLFLAQFEFGMTLNRYFLSSQIKKSVK